MPKVLAAVYKSTKKPDTYLYVEKRDNFEKVPEGLMSTFGTPQLVTMVNLDNRPKLAIADIEKVKAELTENGFYLQLPPPVENLLDEHRATLKAQGKLHEKN